MRKMKAIEYECVRVQRVSNVNARGHELWVRTNVNMRKASMWVKWRVLAMSFYMWLDKTVDSSAAHSSVYSWMRVMPHCAW